NEKVALTVGGARPTTRKKIRIEFSDNTFNGYSGRSSTSVYLLNEYVVDFAAEELNEIRVASGHARYHLYRLVRKCDGAFLVFDPLHDRFATIRISQAIHRNHSKPALRNRPRLPQLGK